MALTIASVMALVMVTGNGVSIIALVTAYELRCWQQYWHYGVGNSMGNIVPAKASVLHHQQRNWSYEISIALALQCYHHHTAVLSWWIRELTMVSRCTAYYSSCNMPGARCTAPATVTIKQWQSKKDSSGTKWMGIQRFTAMVDTTTASSPYWLHLHAVSNQMCYNK